MFSVWPALVTPFDSHGRLCTDVAVSLAESLHSQGAQGVIVAGTTGEFLSLNLTEWSDLVQAIGKSLCPMRVCVALGDPNFDNKLAIIHKTSAQGLLVLPPIYTKPSQAAISHDLEVLQRKTTLPIWLYHNPSRAGVGFDFQGIDKLLQKHGTQICGMKESDDRFAQWPLWLKTHPNFQLLGGDDLWATTFRDLGAYGLISAAANVAMDLLNQALAGKNVSLWLSTVRLLFSAPNPILIKYALVQRGWPVGVPRVLLDVIDPDMYRAVKEHFQKLL